KKILDEMHATTFKLAMDHEKQWREEAEKGMRERNAAVVKALNQTKAAEDDLADYIAKQTLSTTDYQIMKINQWQDAQLAAHDAPRGDYDGYGAAMVGKAELQKQALVKKAEETQQAIAEVIMPDQPIGHGPDTPTPWSNLVPKPIGVSTIGGTINT